MNKVIKLGMTFCEGNVPDFGSIEQDSAGHSLFLLAEDISRLNTVLTKSACLPYLEHGSPFRFHTGDTAYVLDWLTAETASMFIYHSGTDHWYEAIPNE